MPLGAGRVGLTGLTDRQLRGAPPPPDAVRRFLAFAGDAVLVAHNARFDLAFLDRETERLTGSRLAAPVVDTVALARTLLAGRVPRASLAQLAWFFGTSDAAVPPRAPRRAGDGRGAARARSASRRSAARARSPTSSSSRRRARGACCDKRQLAFGAPQRPGVYLFRDRNDQVLYVGCARDLRARLRSYFRSEKLRPAVEAALGATERIEWRVLGSELEAALDGAAADPRAASAGERARLAAGAPRVAAQARRRRRRLVAAVAARADPVAPAARSSRRGRCSPRSSSGRRRRCRGCGGGSRRSSDARRFEDAARLRDRIAALERRLPRARAARAAARARALPARAGGRAGPRRARSSSPAAASPPSGRCRPAAARTSRSRRGSPRRDAPRRQPPRRRSTSTSCSSSARSSAGRRRSCAIVAARARGDPRSRRS